MPFRIRVLKKDLKKKQIERDSFLYFNTATVSVGFMGTNASTFFNINLIAGCFVSHGNNSLENRIPFFKTLHHDSDAGNELVCLLPLF